MSTSKKELRRVLKAATIQKFLVWLHNQPDDRKFIYGNSTKCLIASFLNEGLGDYFNSLEKSCWIGYVAGDTFPYTSASPSVDYTGWLKKLDSALGIRFNTLEKFAIASENESVLEFSIQDVRWLLYELFGSTAGQWERKMTLKLFKQWLKQESADRMIPFYDLKNCIFATWCRECIGLVGQNNVWVSSYTFYDKKGYERTGKMPEWSRRVQRAFHESSDHLASIADIRAMVKKLKL